VYDVHLQYVLLKLYSLVYTKYNIILFKMPANMITISDGHRNALKKKDTLILIFNTYR